MYPMQEIWSRIEAWLTAHAPDALDLLLPGADDDDIQEIEAEIGYRLPEDFRASLRIHNGTLDLFADNWGLLHLDAILWQQQVQLKVLRSLPGDTKEWWWHPHWIPFANDGAGDLLCVDVEPKPSEPLGQVIHFDHETMSQPIAPGFHVLLSTFADHLEAGKYAFDPSGILRSEQFLFSNPQFLSVSR